MAGGAGRGPSKRTIDALSVVLVIVLAIGGVAALNFFGSDNTADQQAGAPPGGGLGAGPGGGPSTALPNSGTPPTGGLPPSGGDTGGGTSAGDGGSGGSATGTGGTGGGLSTGIPDGWLSSPSTQDGSSAPADSGSAPPQGNQHPQPGGAPPRSGPPSGPGTNPGPGQPPGGSNSSGSGGRAVPAQPGLLQLFSAQPIGVPFGGQPMMLPVASLHAPGGAHVVGTHRVNQQILDVTIYSPALGRNTTTRLLLPHGWTRDTSRQWPVLYMLAGYNDGHRQNSWTAYTDVEQFMADKPVLTVLPDPGAAAFANDYWNHGRGGPPDYETYLVQELPAILQSTFHAGDHRAIAGLSVGGYSAMSLASKHHGFYGAAASYSGILNTTLPGIPQFVQLLLRDVGKDPKSLWGDPYAQSAIWRENDPWWNAPNLRGTKLFVSSGTGLRGPHDTPITTLFANLRKHPQSTYQSASRASWLEAGSNLTTHSFALRCRLLGIPITTDYTLTGTHSWGYWQDAFHKSWPVLAQGLGLR